MLRRRLCVLAEGVGGGVFIREPYRIHVVHYVGL